MAETIVVVPPIEMAFFTATFASAVASEPIQLTSPLQFSEPQVVSVSPAHF